LTSWGSTFYAAGTDGRIFQGDFLKLNSKPTGFSNPYPNRIIALSKDQRYLVNGTDSAFVQVFDLADNGRRTVRRISGFAGPTNDIEFLANGSAFIIASGDNKKINYTISFVDHQSGSVRPMVSLPSEIKTINISPDQNWLAAGSWSGKIFMIDLRNNSYTTLLEEPASRILSIKFSPDGKSLAYGTDDLVNKRGLVKIYNLQTKDTRQFTGHQAGVFDVEFSPDGKLLASAGSDRKLQMWVLDHPEDLPIEMDNNNGYIFDILFTRDSDYLIATTSESEVRVWPTDHTLLAEKICPLLSRNLASDEWSKYVGDDIEYEYTCPSLLIKDY
jgi:WD40 repeat protein